MTAVTEAEYKSECEPTKDLRRELWWVFCEAFQENLPRYNGTALHISGDFPFLVLFQYNLLHVQIDTCQLTILTQRAYKMT